MTFKQYFGERMLFIVIMIGENSSYHLISTHLVADGMLCFMYITIFVSHHNSIGYYCVNS